MRILAIADRRPDQPIHDIVAASSVDVIVTLGDLELSDLRALEDIDLPKLGVYGNHCSGMYMSELGIENMHATTREVLGVRFGGFEGCVRYKQSSAKMYTQEEASAMLATLPHVDVMLTHCPPFGINDDQSDVSHTGFIGLRDYVLREKPGHLFHGHTYPRANEITTHLGETAITYVFGHLVIEI